jgi:hypothetical protein
VNSSLNAATQTALPDWVRSRGMAIYLLVFSAGQALGAVAWGLVVQQADTRTAFTGVAAGLVLGVAGARHWPLPAFGDLDLTPARVWPEPALAAPVPGAAGPVLVVVEYRVPAADEDAFVTAMAPVGRARRRSGATRWGLFRDGAAPGTWVETYLVPTWEEHLRQHDERLTVRDEQLEARARGLARAGDPEVRHLLSAYR